MSESQGGQAKDRVTIYQVAERAGVSIATVSHALNRPGKVNPATRERVLEAVDELGFVPKATAVSQARRGVGLIGVLAAFSAYPSYLARLTGVMQACRDKDVDVAVYDASGAGVDPLLSTLPATGRLDGLLVMGHHLDDAAAARLVQRGIPTVLVDSLHPSFTSVTVDDDLGGFLLGQHLAASGYDSLAIATPEPISADFESQGEHRLTGLLRALRAAGVAAEQATALITQDDYEGGLAAADELVKLDPMPRVVIAHHDAIAAGLLRGLSRAGVKVPDQVAVTGYDGTDLASALDLTTVRQPFAETGRLGAELLLEQLTGEARPRQHIRLIPELVVGSTA